VLTEKPLDKAHSALLMIAAMPPTQTSRDYTAFKAAYRYGSHPIGNLNTVIHDDDEMLLYTNTLQQIPQKALQTYFSQGVGMLTIVRQILEWKFGQPEKVSAFLDFACGYGRFTRFLASLLPPERIWVSDIYEEGVVFQREQFGVNGIVSVTNPDEYTCDQRFDFIYVASLFSHLPEPRFTQWLRKLFSLLTPDGILVFSACDESLLPAGVPMAAQGIFFHPQSESSSLDKEQYGATWITQAFMQKVIADVSGRADNYCWLSRGLLGHQDLYILPAREGVDFSTLQISGPMGVVEKSIASKPGELVVTGWAADLVPDASISDVQIWIDGRLAQRCIPYISRPDVAKHFNRPSAEISGWQCFCRWDGSVDKLLVVNVYNSFGVDQVIGSGTVADFLGK
jgi:SAM-dependent methyltransferase